MTQGQLPFTIVSANYNSARKLLDTYKSIASQTVEFEYLIMDGVSTDGSLEIARQLAADDPRVHVYSEKDRGLFDAMNKAVVKATGRYIYFIGAGDLLYPGSLNEILKQLPADDTSVVYGDCMMDGQRYFGEFDKMLIAYQNICHQGVFYGRDVFQLVGNYNLRYTRWSDWELDMRCFADSRVRMMYVPVVVAFFEMGGFSTPGDDVFRSDQLRLILEHLGVVIYLRVALRPLYNHITASFGRILKPSKKRRKKG